MKFGSRSVILWWAGVVLSACSSIPAGAEIVSTPTVQVITTPIPFPTALQVDTSTLSAELPAQLRPAQEQLIKNLGISSEELVLESYSAVEWPDSCLSVHLPGIACLDVITSGYLVIFNTPSGKVEVHTNMDGSVVRIVPQESGIQGQAMVGPACPGPVQVDNPCPDQPYKGYLIVVDSEGNIAAEIKTYDDGSFQVSLPPGTYRITTPPGNMLPALPPQEFKVNPGQYTAIQLSLDSGMR